jgi:hypothetical protein
MDRNSASVVIVSLLTLILAFLPSKQAAQVPVVENNQPPVRMDRLYPDPEQPHVPNPVAAYEGTPDDEEELKNCQVPIPMKDRVFNRTGIQCVWCSIECLGRWAEEKKLVGPPCMTDWPDCKSYSGPGSAGSKLREIKVRFEQVTDKTKGRELIRRCVVQERRGVLFSVPGHAMNLVHYDEQNKIVKYINNSDKTLKVRTWTMDEFEKRWEGWVLAIYADNDIIPFKFTPPACLIPIVDRMGNGVFDPKQYILIPGR